jgi:hypothetical protein
MIADHANRAGSSHLGIGDVVLVNFFARFAGVLTPAIPPGVGRFALASTVDG